VAGANRGLGLGLTKRLLERPATTVVASVRSHDAATSLRSDIESVAVGENSTLHIIELDFSTALSPDEITTAFAAAVSAGDAYRCGHLQCRIPDAHDSGSSDFGGRSSQIVRSQYHCPAPRVPGLLATYAEIGFSAQDSRHLLLRRFDYLPGAFPRWRIWSQ
jgi:NAD(P)-dependent dehydrogenase (short-subunit alcohol dehydrogenase family)